MYEFDLENVQYDPNDPASQQLEPSEPAPRRGLDYLVALIVKAPRLVLLTVAFVAVLAFFGVRLYRLQIAEAQLWTARAEAQRARLVRVAAPRGLIYDRDGAPLVQNAPAFEVVIIPALLPDAQEEPEEHVRVLQRLGVLLNQPYEEIQAAVDWALDPRLRSYAPYSPLVIARNVDRQISMIISQEGLTLPGVQINVTARRHYLHGELLAQIVGYMGAIPEGQADAYVEAGYDLSSDRVGYSGIEYSFEDLMRGVAGERYQEEDVLGRPIRIIGQQVPPVPGHNIYLTIDTELQQVVHDALVRGMERARSPRGVVIAMDPRTGEVLAMVSLPTYDNNLFARGISVADYQRLMEDPHLPLVNHAISDNLPPGSIYKIIPAAAALQEGVLTRRTRLNCPGTIELPNRYYPNDPALAQPFYCWRLAGHGWLDVVGGLVNSCDIFFYEVAGGSEADNFVGLGIDRLAAYSRLFGLGSPTGIELPGEASGLVPDPTWKRLTIGQNWSTGDTYIMGIGQGYLLATPLQMANMMATTANGGTLYVPQIVHHVTDAEGNVVRPFEPIISHTLPISAENWSIIYEGLEGAVAYGTAPRAQVEGVRVAGKTGTAEYCDDIAIQNNRCVAGRILPTHAWFTAYAPVEAPEIALVVFLYDGGEGSTFAAPVAQEILDWYFHHNDQPDEE